MHSPKLDKKERFLLWYIWYPTEFDFNVLFIHLHIRIMPFNALVFTLHSKVELNWTRAIRPVIAQSIPFSKIVKKHRFVPIFSYRKEALSLSKSWNKNWGHRSRFWGRAAESAHQMHFFWFLRGASFKIECMWKGQESIKKSVFTEFSLRYHI